MRLQCLLLGSVLLQCLLLFSPIPQLLLFVLRDPEVLGLHLVFSQISVCRGCMLSVQFQLQHPALQPQDLTLQLEDFSLVLLLQAMGSDLQVDQLLGDQQPLLLTQLYI